VKKRPEPDPISMTPMIDIVFQLIIFFVLTASNDPTKLNEKLELAETPNAPEVKEPELGTVHIQVRDNGMITIGPAIYSLPVLRAHMQQMVSRYGQNVPIVIHADGRTVHGNVSRVMNALSSVGLWQIKLSAYTLHRN
jgi:biopolymer transport protein ExbD